MIIPVISLSALSELIFPSRCLGCRQLGIGICSRCRASWHPHIYRSSISTVNYSFPVYSAVAYSPVAQKVLLGAKEGALHDADRLIHQALTHSLAYFYSEVGIADLVPIPSRKMNTRKRGRDFILEQTYEVSRAPSVRVRAILTHSRKVKDQTTLNSRSREINLSQSMSCANREKSSNIPVIIIDDLVTSGATLREAGRALHGAGYTVIGAVTACVAKPLRYTQ
jgi:predicted amidophosphoribosyltransferase